MTVDTAPRTRRGFLSLLVAAASGAAAASIAGVQRALAAGSDGTPIAVGGLYTDARSLTRVSNNTDNTVVLEIVNNQSGRGLMAFSYGGTAIRAESWSGEALNATTQDGTSAIHAETKKNSGTAYTILSEARTGGGVALLANNYATSGKAQGVQGTSDSPTGLATTGWARAKGAGVVGISGATVPTIPAGVGVYGNAAAGRGGVFSGGRSQVRLVPSTASTHPSSGSRGDLFVDKSGRLWYCKGGSSWKQLA